MSTKEKLGIDAKEELDKMLSEDTITMTEENIKNDVKELVNDNNIKDENKEKVMDELDKRPNIEKSNTIKRKKPKKKREIPLKSMVEFAETFSSTGASFVLATLGIITQTFHNGFLFFELSSFENFWLNLLQTTIGACGLSGALLYFTIRASNGGNAIVKKLVWAFFAFEIYANLYYWSNKYIISVWGTDAVNWSSMIIAVPFAIMIPFTIKAYAGELNFQGLLDDDDDDEDEYEDVIMPTIDTETIKNDITETLRNDISEMKTTSDKQENDLKRIKEHINDVDKRLSGSIQEGESFNLNVTTTDNDGEKTTKILRSVIERN